jgi:hypothetical protein
MLTPARTEVARHLARYRESERLMLVSPQNPAARGDFENTGRTLRDLMGARCAREAAEAAERYLRSDVTPTPRGAPAPAAPHRGTATPTAPHRGTPATGVRRRAAAPPAHRGAATPSAHRGASTSAATP